MISRRHLLLSAAAAGTGWPAFAETSRRYPARPITLIVPYGAGGPTDAIARLLAERMRVVLGQPIVIENVTGAAGSIGIGKAARSEPDGYTICIGTWATHVLNGAVLTLPYNIEAALDPIAQVASDPPLIVSNPKVSAGNLAEFIRWLQANPEKATQGTGGPGSGSHVLGALFQRRTGTRFQLVPYRTGVGVATQDMVAGHIDFLFSVAGSAVPLLRAGTVKGYAVTAPERLGILPDIPTVDEAGLPGFHMSNWHGLWAPKGVPAEIRSALNAAAVEALADPAVARKLVELGQAIAPRDRQTPEGLASLHKTEIDKWWPLIRDAGAKLE